MAVWGTIGNALKTGAKKFGEVAKTGKDKLVDMLQSSTEPQPSPTPRPTPEPIPDDTTKTPDEIEAEKRRKLLENAPLKYVYVFTNRVNPMRNGEPLDENGKKWSSTMCFAWFVFEKHYDGEPMIRWL